ncbi:MAG TPA: hypothetical protein VFS09_04720 [Candidatus Eisenbacteria bacterium]|nr:hypothetical protein [Candidatus Eisenbacteria bacterium]
MNRFLRTVAAFSVAWCLAGAGAPAAPAATAPELPAAAACPGGNLLADARVADSLDVRGPFGSVVDDYGAADGGTLSSSQGIHFLTNAGSLTYDLGADRPIAAALVQADANNGFSLQVSEDGASFREVWAIPNLMMTARGLQTRFMSFSDLHARFVRFGEPTGPGARSVSEVQVYCEIPAAWPMPLTIAPKPPPSPPAPWTPARFVRVHGGTVKMAIALLGALLLAWGAWLNRRGTPGRSRRLRDALLIALALLGYASYYNWGFLHFGNRIHYHEFFHYYIGAKYFPELGYTHLYECANLAEAEQGFSRRVELRTIRDLHRNELVSGRYVLEDPERFKRGFARPFTPKRWEEFKSDVAFFRSNVEIGTWENMLRDHGYNPSPLWNMTGSLLSNLGPASKGFLEGFLALIDPILLLVTFGFVAWAFGWRVACVSIIFFGTNEPALFFWTGGAFLRQDWFLFAMAGICLLKRGKPALGGASLAVSTLLRVFPLGFFVAIGLRILWVLFRERRIDPTAAKIVAGAALATAILIPASSVVAGSASAWPEFVKNTKKHAGSPLTNYMGLRTIVGFRWETRQRFTFNPNAADPFHDFREARKRAFAGIFGQPLFVVLVVAYLGLLSWGLRREMEWWVLAAFGFGVISVGMELTCYYFSFLMAAAFLGEKRPAIPIGLLVLSAVGHVITTGTYYYDMRYYCQSVAVIAFVVWAAWIYGRGPAPSAAAPVTAV